MAKTTLILGNSFFLKKLRTCFWKNSRLFNKADYYDSFTDFYENA